MPTSSVKPTDPAALELELAALENEGRRHAENIETYRNLSAHYGAEVARLEAEIGEITESLGGVEAGTDGGAHERLDMKKALIHCEFDRDLNQFENSKLQPQIEEAEAAIDTNAKAIAAFRKDLS